MSLFASSPETIVQGESALRIISLGFVVSAASVVCSGALEGLGKGAASFWISSFRYVLIIIPTAWILSSLLQASGVWWAIVIAEWICALISWIIYHEAFKNIQTAKSCPL